MSTFEWQTSEPTVTRRASQASHDGFRCHLCGDVIGVYEPLILCPDSMPRTTSRAAEPTLAPGDVYYHPACFIRRHTGASV